MNAPPASLPTLAPGAGAWTRLSLAVRCLLVLKDAPGDTHHAVLFNACMDRETFAAVADDWRRSPQGRARLEARASLQGADLDVAALRALPDGTLGRALMAYFDGLGIDPFESGYPIESDADYMSLRYRETHDIVHVLTGYGIDDWSEMELQAFVYGNLRLRQNLFIVLAGVVQIVPKVGLWAMRRYPGALLRAWRRGQRSRRLLDVRFEEQWARPLAEVQAELVAPGGDRPPSPLAG